MGRRSECLNDERYTYVCLRNTGREEGGGGSVYVRVRKWVWRRERDGKVFDVLVHARKGRGQGEKGVLVLGCCEGGNKRILLFSFVEEG